MDLLEVLLPNESNAAFLAADKATEKINNEIRFENFLPQAQEKNILTVLPNCKSEPPFIKDVYTDLYNRLVKKNIITSKFGAASLWTWDSIYTINKTLIEESDLRKLLKREDLPKSFDCYTIHYDKLSELFKNYNYNFTDELKLVGGIIRGKRTLLNRRKNRTNRRNRRYRTRSTRKV